MIQGINLDAMDQEDLWMFWTSTSTRTVVKARELFPTRPKGYVTATKNLGHYASNKATAMKCRLAGKIDTALMYEGICDRIYEKLPEFARW